jgi:hypothetical protein
MGAAARTNAAGTSLRVVPHPERGSEAVFGPLPRSRVYERVLRALAVRVAEVHEALRLRGEPLRLLPQDRPLSELELGELSWRVYALALATHSSLVRCEPTLLVLAAEWLHSPEPEVWEWFCESQS